MRFHSTAHDDKNQKVFECHVFADSSGGASDKVKQHLQANGAEGAKQLIVWSIEVRDDIATELPVINTKTKSPLP